MPVAIIGGTGPTVQNPYRSKSPNLRVRLSADTAGDVTRLPFHSLWTLGQNMGLSFQSGKRGASTIVIVTTMDPEEKAMNPDLDSDINWESLTSMNVTTTYQTTKIFTVAKITFTQPNDLSIMNL
jgi:phosphodiesterase/alkaline phosphatase D-like protein